MTNQCIKATKASEDPSQHTLNKGVRITSKYCLVTLGVGHLFHLPITLINLVSEVKVIALTGPSKFIAISHSITLLTISHPFDMQNNLITQQATVILTPSESPSRTEQ